MKERNDDFELRAKHLQGMTDEELDKYFWELTEKVVNPLVNLAETHTSQSIERSVLLRMGFNSLQASKLVDRIFEKNLLSKGAGNVIYRVSKELNSDIIKTGTEMVDGKHWEIADALFEGSEK
ncbi:MAG TPA: ornithine aminomutase subunit alpha [Tepiditoga sp.]|nr:ornithine aminomutase subunit alpha [Thermotogota bacterium]HOO73698.1 ornithine aminomutase subunit alpha [Tepiditoga sp.]